ncbi:MAG: fibronectin type III domain-containing protein, partial [Psychrosphaera sp.]|nr:fibronectin type III domain-containing protein [Psychrosphaera sp.]
MKTISTQRQWLAYLLGATTLGVSLTASAENWIPIGVDSNLIFIPQYLFQNTQTSSGNYTLSWNHQHEADSYLIERLSFDDSATVPSTVTPTVWKTVGQTSENSLAVTHKLKDYDLGGYQEYRLSKCLGTSCTILDSMSYSIEADELVDAIPTGFTVSNTVSKTMTFGASGSGANPYAKGYGWSDFTGHGAPENTAVQTLQTSKSTGILSSTYSAPRRQITLKWDTVKGAKSYIVSRIPDRGSNPTYTRMKDYPQLLEATTNSYNFGLRSGTYDFVVYACLDFGRCGTPTVTHTESVTVPEDTDHQPQDFNVSVGSNDVVTLSWNAPPATDASVVNYQVIGELGYIIAEPASNVFQLTRNDGVNSLPPGRKYCYSIRAVFGTNSYGDFVPGQCVSIGGPSVFTAPGRVSMINHVRVFNPADVDTTELAYYINWGSVAGADYYQVDRELDYSGSGNWSPVYHGKSPFTFL